MKQSEITKELLRDNHIVVMPTGAIWSFKGSGKPLKSRLNRTNGYRRVNLTLWSFKVNGKRDKSHFTSLSVHLAVMICHGEPKPFDDAVINHKDGNKLNNHIDNLEWVTQSQNVKHYHQLLKIGLDGTAENL